MAPRSTPESTEQVCIRYVAEGKVTTSTTVDEAVGHGGNISDRTFGSVQGCSATGVLKTKEP